MIHPFARKLALSLALLACSTPSAFATAVAINEEDGCKQGKVQEHRRKFCADFESMPGFLAEPTIKAAHEKCLAFYEQALRTQNVFCSYRTDAVIFGVFSAVNRETANDPLAQVAPDLAKQNASQQAVSRDNRRVAAINKAYMDRIKDITPKLQKAYQEYFQAINKVSADAGADIVSEAACVASNIRSLVPAFFREALAGLSHGKSQVTMQSMIKAVRENYRVLKAVKAEAEENASIAEMRNLEAGSVFMDKITEPRPQSDKIELPNSYNGANPWVQFVSSKAAEKVATFSKAGGIVGGATVFVFQVATGQTVSVSDTALMVTGVFTPVGALGAGYFRHIYNQNVEIQGKYREMCREELAKDIKQDSLQLMEIWGRRTSNSKCKPAVESERRCVEYRRQNPRQAYDNGPCRRGITEPPGPGGR